jgi:murein DD-endopeptidase MepM/ murein hydrolase activator NlpD
MPRLPDIDSLGSRPVPQSRRGVSAARNAGSVADAVGGVAGQISEIGSGILEKQDKLSYAAAKSFVQREDLLIRQELEADTGGYDTYESRYQDRIGKAREKATALIKSKTDRRLFELDTTVDVDRGKGQVQELARKRGTAARLSTLGNVLDIQTGLARGAKDDASRESIIKTVTDAISGASENGDIDALKAGELRRSWVGGFARERVMASLDDGDVDAARKDFEKYNSFLSSEDYSRLYGAIDQESDKRDVFGAVDIGYTGITDEVTDQKLVMPVDGELRVSSGIGARSAPIAGASTSHNGLDIPKPLGSPVRASGAGKVIKAWNDTKNGGGLSMIVDYGNGVTMGYAHLSAQDKKDGDIVNPGDIIGKVGSTGKSTGSHLHWTAKINGKVVDPRNVKLSGVKASTVDDAIASSVSALQAKYASEGRKPSPDLIEATRTEAQRRFNSDKASRDQKQELTVEAAQQALVKNGGNYYALPSSLRAQIPAKYIPGLINFGEGLQPNPPKRETDPNEYVRLMTMAATDPTSFAKINPVSYVGKFEKGDWEEFNRLRAGIISGKGEKDDKQVSLETVNRVTNNLLNSLDLNDSGKKASTPEAKARINARQYQFQKAMLADIEAFRAANKKNPDDAQIQAMADRRALQWNIGEDGKPVYQFEASGRAGRVAIPTKDAQRIKQRFIAAGRMPTEEDITRVYQLEGRLGK